MGGTEAFPDLGQHCQHSDCHQLDFLPFSCNRCQKVFCAEHRTYRSHDCPKSDDKSRKVIVCEICSKSMEITGLSCEQETAMKEKHANSKECDPSKKKKPRCPVKRCRENLTFSNATVCRCCNTKVCLKHRLPADHECIRGNSSIVTLSGNGGLGNKFLAALVARNGKDCAKNNRGQVSPTSSSQSVKAC
ncbi:hypothetical protein SOVF_052370 [Spinacia oleracea]|uniref:Zinc finger AN1 domain-containing stress-associated protein 12 n=1 Tax=Spinacia oleracea TaxID=3562 RepID=A0A9R0K6K1_SPIOL|nr:zinc finger AN1 domain-containing stress-associated protein 12 [Spinacia oleracea]KNA20442.1 hypothetical protein SOVF_052370 [Spinacia oleracea]